jgi:glycosyltransferase involved in cell wall biosynthesis
MSKNILLSVLVITYNQEEYIAQTLVSILEQVHSYSYEIVIGDDCSKDNTRNIIEKYRGLYPTIIKPIYNDSNLGLIKNYYNVLKYCRGKYIMQCAGDDWWLPNKVSTQVHFMEQNPSVGLCFGRVKIFSNNSFSEYVTDSKEVSFSELIKNNTIPALTVCMRNDTLVKYIEDVDPLSKNWIMEDYPIWLWHSKKSKIEFIDQFFGVYRVLTNSLSHSNNIEKRMSFLLNTYEIQEFFCNKFGERNSNKNAHFFSQNDNYRVIIDDISYKNSEYTRFFYKVKNKTFKIWIKYFLAIIVKHRNKINNEE